MPRLSTDSQDAKRTSANSSLRARIKRAQKAVLRSYKVNLLKGRDLPIRLRPWFLLFTAFILVLLGLLGISTLHLPLNDKILHFVCMGTATGVFYWIFDIDEDARRVWLWRYSALIFTFSVCFIVGGIFSEFVQSMLPFKNFEWGDVIANILGSSCGLIVAYTLEKYYRKRREIARLYQPINADAEDAISDDELDGLTSEAHVLPLYRPQSKSTDSPTRSSRGPSRMRDVWDDREELFAVGEENEDQHEDNSHSRPSSPQS